MGVCRKRNIVGLNCSQSLLGLEVSDAIKLTDCCNGARLSCHHSSLRRMSKTDILEITALSTICSLQSIGASLHVRSHHRSCKLRQVTYVYRVH